MSCGIAIRVINGRGNTDALVFGIKSSAGVVSLYPFGDVTRMTLEFAVSGVPYGVDSAVSTGAIDWSAGNGEVEFDLGDEDLPLGTHEAKLYLYSPTYPTGFLLDAGEGYTMLLEVTE
tara:strand:+ start:30693 stop:31046 length:354 start_codon:yes stop_codon:yes gene_type:complete